jgi:hypothetical protein
VGAFEGLADGAILIANSFACGWVPGLNRAAEQVRTANAGSMAYTVADWSASVGTALLPIGGGVKGFNLGMKAASKAPGLLLWPRRKGLQRSQRLGRKARLGHHRKHLDREGGRVGGGTVGTEGVAACEECGVERSFVGLRQVCWQELLGRAG